MLIDISKYYNSITSNYRDMVILELKKKKKKRLDSLSGLVALYFTEP